jgi:hypothetical protein
MKYVTIYRHFFIPTLRTEEETGSKPVLTKRWTELKDWTDALNNYAQQGFKVINSGTFRGEKSSEHIVFWATLEKPEEKHGKVVIGKPKP